MKKYNKTLLAVIAIGLFLGSQTAKALITTPDWTFFPAIENKTDKPIQVRVAYMGETDWGFGNCTLCPNFYTIGPKSTGRIERLGRLVTNIEIFDADRKKSYGWTNDLKGDDLNRIVFDKGKIWRDEGIISKLREAGRFQG